MFTFFCIFGIMNSLTEALGRIHAVQTQRLRHPSAYVVRALIDLSVCLGLGWLIVKLNTGAFR